MSERERLDLFKGWIDQPTVDVPVIPVTKASPSPWRHQATAWSIAKERPGYMYAMDMGTGKSRTTIDSLQNWDSGPILVIAPKAVLATWPHEVAKHAVEPWPVLTLNQGSVKARIEAAEKFLRLVGTRKRSMVVVNYEAFVTNDFRVWAHKQLWAAIICDESQRIKSPNGVTAKAISRLQTRSGKRLCLSGTPMPHSPFDVYAQYRFMNDKIFGSSFVAFRARYAVTHPEYKSKVLRWLNLDELTKIVAEHSFRVLASDVLDLPPRLEIDVPIEISASARKVYDDLENDFYARIESREIDASNALVQLLRLQQIVGGWISTRDPDSQTTSVDRIDWAKEQALESIVEDLGEETVVVFCRFKAELANCRMLAERLGIRFGELSGAHNDLVPSPEAKARGEKIGNQLPKWGSKGIFAVQIKSGGAGVDLSYSSAGVYWSCGHSAGEYDQSAARLHRPGQTRPVRLWRLIATRSVDEQIYESIREKKELTSMILDLRRPMR